MLGIVHYLDSKDFVVLNGINYIPYKSVVLGLGISSHVHQLHRRRANYPAEFIDIEGTPYISIRYAILLERFHTAQAELNNLKTKGGGLG